MNYGLYANNGKLVDIFKYGITVKELCDYHIGTEILNEDMDYYGIYYIIMDKFFIRKTYLREYLKITNDPEEIELINDFIINYEYYLAKRNNFKILKKELEVENKNSKIEYSKIQEIDAVINQIYDDIENGNLSKEDASKYIDTLEKLEELYHKMYHYDLSLNRNFKNIQNKLNDFVNRMVL